MALKTPFFLFFDCFVKNETVNGIIGKTHGVSNANKPPTNPKKKMLNNPFELSEFVSAEFFKRFVFFKSNFKFSVRFLLFSSITMVSFEAFPDKEIVKSSSIFIQAVSQTCPKKFNLI